MLQKIPSKYISEYWEIRNFLFINENYIIALERSLQTILRIELKYLNRFTKNE